MRSVTLSTLEYDVDIPELLIRRLRRNGSKYKITDSAERSLTISVYEDDMDGVIDSVCDLILLDIAQFEIADIVRSQSLSLSDQKLVLIEAIGYSKTISRTSVRRAIAEHFSENDSLVIEGFVRFRMRDTMLIWERCVDKATEELLIKIEHMELMGLLSAFVKMHPTRINEVAVIIRPDGACSLTDDSDTHIDYPPDAAESLLSLLISLSPQRITVYDMSDGLSSGLLNSIYRVFEERVRVYRTVKP